MDIEGLLPRDLLRARYVVPLLLALGVGALAWVGMQALLPQEDDRPPTTVLETPAVEPQAPTSPVPVIEPQPPPPPRTSYVLVAERDIAVGEFIGTGDLTWKERLGEPEAGLVERDTEEGGMDKHLGKVARSVIRAGEPVRYDALLSIWDLEYLTTVLRPGYRALKVTVSPSSPTTGRPGDRVDIILVARDIRGVDVPVAQRLVRDARVLKNEEDGQITLEVSPRTADRLVLAQEVGGSLTAVLRSDTTAESDAAYASPVRADELVTVPFALPTTPTTLRIFRGTEAQAVVLDVADKAEPTASGVLGTADDGDDA